MKLYSKICKRLKIRAAAIELADFDDVSRGFSMEMQLLWGSCIDFQVVSEIFGGGYWVKKRSK